MKRTIVLLSVFVFIGGCSFIQQRIPCFLPGDYEEQVEAVKRINANRSANEAADANGLGVQSAAPSPVTVSPTVASEPVSGPAPTPPAVEPDPPSVEPDPPTVEPKPPGCPKPHPPCCPGKGKHGRGCPGKGHHGKGYHHGGHHGKGHHGCFR